LNPYTYSISLRVRHPTIDPANISQALDLMPERSWYSGAPRTTPKGEQLDGTYRETYWSSCLDQQVSSVGTSVEERLAALITRLQSHLQFFTEICHDGGEVEFFVGLFGSENFGVELSPKLMNSLAASHIGLAFDVYP
jgi:hypothetical protein